MLHAYFKGLYTRTMDKAYACALKEIVAHLKLKEDGNCLDCGAQSGHLYNKLTQEISLTRKNYYGIEWDKNSVNKAVQNGLNVIHGDLNKQLPFENDNFDCIFALSVLEHLLNGCFFIKESYRTLKMGGRLVILTPNISTYFTAALIVAVKMPSSGPHPDSEVLIHYEELYKVSSNALQSDAESDTPMHRHLVVFSFKVLKKYLKMIGFSKVEGYGFGLYPFPNFMQPVLEKIDPYHCHQMVFIAEK